jgi:ABC-type amino acid transport system permease subunit
MKKNNTLIRDSVDNVKNNIIQNLQQNGISKCYEFLNKKNLDIIEKILIKNKGIKSNKNSFYYRPHNNYLLKKNIEF